MFLKQNILERLLKQAYKTSGLTVMQYECSDGRAAYTIIGNYWKIWMLSNRMPKEVKAALIKLCGDLPEVGEAFMSMKDRENQYELDIAFEKLPEEFTKCELEFRRTNLVQTSKSGLLRYYQNETGAVVTIREEMNALVNLNAIDRDNGEREPEGPLMNADNPYYIWWGNEWCILKTGLVYGEPEEKEFRLALRKTRII